MITLQFIIFNKTVVAAANSIPLAGEINGGANKNRAAFLSLSLSLFLNK